MKIEKCIEENKKLLKENKKLKEELEHYKSVTDKINVMLHINKFNGDGLTDIIWHNKTYEDFSSIPVDDRNKKTKKYYANTYHAEDMKTIHSFIKKIQKEPKNYSFIYKYTKDKDEKRWLASFCSPYKFSEDGTLTEVIIASIELDNNIFNPERYTAMLKELNYLKNKLKISQLTKAELLIIKLLSSGKSEKEIAAMQNRSIHTIKTHIKNIREKLDIKKNTELVTFACQVGIG